MPDTKWLQTTPPRIGLALSGGSIWGMAHIGVLRALEENKILIHCIAGTSAGALAAAFFAFNVPPQKMMELSKNVNWKTLSTFTFSRFGFSTNKVMAEFVRSELGDVHICDAKIPLAIVATNIERGTKKVFRIGNLADIVRASTSIPGIFVPVEIDGELYVDGGISERLPLSPLKEMGADMTIGVHLSSTLKNVRPKDVRGVLMRSIGILSRERDAYVKGLADVLIEPDMSNFTSSDFSEAEHLQEEGYRATIAALPRIRQHIDRYQSIDARLSRKVRSWFSLLKGD